MKRLILISLFCTLAFGQYVHVQIPPGGRSPVLPGDIVVPVTDTSGIMTFTGTGTGNLTPKVTFSSGTVDLYIGGSFSTSLTTATEASVAVTVGQSVQYVFSNPESVTAIDFASDNIAGPISQLRQFTNLTVLSLNNCSLITGDLSDLTGMSLTYLNLNSCSLVTGDLSDLTGMSLTFLNLNSCSLVTGDLSDLAGMSLTFLSLYSCSLVTWTSGALDTKTVMTTCNLGNMGLIQADVTSILLSCTVNDAAGSPARNCTLTLTGNAAPDATGLGYRDTLVASGWTVAVAP
jgi:hypothetical protein